jgi:hypothetical protein
LSGGDLAVAKQDSAQDVILRLREALPRIFDRAVHIHIDTDLLQAWHDLNFLIRMLPYKQRANIESSDMAAWLGLGSGAPG